MIGQARHIEEMEREQHEKIERRKRSHPSSSPERESLLEECNSCYSALIYGPTSIVDKGADTSKQRAERIEQRISSTHGLIFIWGRLPLITLGDGAPADLFAKVTGTGRMSRCLSCFLFLFFLSQIFPPPLLLPSRHTFDQTFSRDMFDFRSN